MLFKKIAIAAAVATTLAFVGCAKKTEEAPAAASEVATSEIAAASDAAVQAEAAASEATVAASEAIDAASEVAASEAK
ncbi:hypothetical protein [Acinetobacter faecalis]|uniref:hypothetical protein n=1 Tax=Acinetobacter faecalis TaxID=2665161 RepID=UPI002A9179F1|nr:hypothetical protein [Acinetobacter faecalis]MDY6461162.1 hypothetical protein [Acinetobacter faecalis]